MKLTRSDIALIVVGVVVGVIFLAKLAFHDDAIYGADGLLREKVLLAIGGACKLGALVVGAVASVKSAGTFERGSTMRFGWMAAAIWFITWSIAQSILVVYQLALDESAPFPSPADPFFSVGYIAMIASFTGFVKSYASTGFFGSTRALATVGIVAAIPYTLVGVYVLKPVVDAGGAPVSLVLNVAYPALDIIALIPVVILVRIALRLRGGSVFWVWALMSAGIVCMVAGDLLYAWFSTLKFDSLDPLLDFSYIAGYGLAGRAAWQQRRVNVA